VAPEPKEIFRLRNTAAKKRERTKESVTKNNKNDKIQELHDMEA
jgi:hypothetical protein